MKPGTEAIPVRAFECEIEEHNPQADGAAVVAIPDGKGGTIMICQSCLEDLFETVTGKHAN